MKEPLEVPRGVSASAGRCGTGKASDAAFAGGRAGDASAFAGGRAGDASAFAGGRAGDGLGMLRRGEGVGRGDGKEALAAARAADAARETEALGKDIKRVAELGRRGVASCSSGTLSDLPLSTSSAASSCSSSSSLSAFTAPLSKA